MNKVLSLLALVLCFFLTACDEWTNPIQTTDASAKGTLTFSNRDLPVDSAGVACGTGRHIYQQYYGDSLPFAGADTSKPYFWTGIGNDGHRMYGVLNTGKISYGTAKFLCVQE